MKTNVSSFSLPWCTILLCPWCWQCYGWLCCYGWLWAASGEQPVASSSGMPWPGLPSLSVNPSLSMVILQDLLFLYQVVADAKAIPSCSMALAAFSASARCLSPFTCSKCMLSRDGKMGCSALETGCVHSSLGMIFPAEGPVWITLALSPNEGLMPSLSNVMPCGGGRTRGLSSIHPPEAPPLPGLLAGLVHPPRSVGGCFRVCWHTWCPSCQVSLLAGLPWCVLSPDLLPVWGVNPPSLASRWAHRSRAGVGRNVQTAHVLCPGFML